MKLFIDTADVAQIREAWSWGIIDGVTTNPSHVHKSGRKPAEVYREICDIVNGPISLETIALDADGIVKEGVELAKIHKNVVIKVPIIKEGLKAVKRLASEGYKTNVTVTFSPLQALLAAKVGATYISPFVGRLDAVGHDGMDLVRQIKTIYQNYGFKTQIIAAAARHPLHVLQAAQAGSDIMTMSFDILEQLYQHPLTDVVLNQFLNDWAKIPVSRRAKMKTYPLYLNGEFVASEPAWDVINPATGEAFARISTVDRRRVAQALTDAHTAFPGWRQLTAKARGEYLRRIASELERRRDEIARLISSENGKPLAQSLGEIGMTVDHLQWFAEEGRRAYGRVIPHQAAGKRNIVIKTPIGIVGAISPWNFPLVLAVRKLAPALAAGCPVVLKPARQTPLSCIAFAECCQAAQLPKGVLQVVVGQSNEIGHEFLTNPLCRKVTFTGSTEVGRELIRGAADTVKPLSLELGGNAPLLVFEDADLKVAVEGAMLAKMRNTGQSCIASNRLLVHRPVYRQFLEAFTAQVKALKVGEFSEPGVEIGPMIDETAFKHALALVQDAVKRGAKVLCGGKQVQRKGFFLEPTVLADVPADGLCQHEEIFAPMAPVTAFDTEEEAVRLANNTPFGLSAYAFTRDVGRVFRLAESLEAGMIGINDGLPTTSNAPFGGVKQSGWGRELGSEGLDAFLETKHISIAIG